MPKRTKKKKPPFERRCNKCGAKQEPDLKKSNKNWKCYGNEKCKCGGKFEIKITPNQLLK